MNIKEIIGMINISSILIPSLWVIGGFLTGLILDRIVIPRLKNIVLKAGWDIAEIALNSVKGTLVFIFTLEGINIAIRIAGIWGDYFYYYNNFTIITLILIVTIIITRILTRSVNFYTGKEKKHTTVSILENIIKVIIFTVGILVMLQILGISITPIITALGIGGLAVALALQSTLSNLFAGIHIVATSKVRQGDFVRLDRGGEGYVQDINWRNTVIKSITDNNIIVPNSELADTVVTNFSQPAEELEARVEVGVDYGSDLEKVEEVTLEVARQTVEEVEGGISSPEPRLLFHTFDDFSINFTIIMRGEEFRNRRTLTHEFIKRLRRRYDQEDIVIPFPIRSVQMQSRD